MRAERMEIMRLNGHNDQCTCAECGLAQDFPLTPLTAGEQAGEPASIGIELNEREQGIIERRFEEHPPLPGLVKERAQWPLPPEVWNAFVIGAIELDHAPSTGRIVALKLRVRDGGARETEWAIWWDRERNALVARPLRVEQG